MASREFETFYKKIVKAPQQEISLAAARHTMQLLVTEYPAAPDIQLTPVTIGKLSAAWVHAPTSTRHRVILFFHGGGYTAGSWLSHQDLIGRLARATGCDILAVDYRLAPEHPFPAAVEDALSSYHHLLAEKISPSNIFVAGTSAGGGLAIALLLKLKAQQAPMPKAALCMCPWVDLALTGSTLDLNEGKDLIQKARLVSGASSYLQGHDPRDPCASPLYANLSGLPPLLIQVGTRELLLDEIEQFAHKAQESGVHVQLERFEEMIHNWQLFAAKIPEGREAIEKIGAFVQSL